MNTPLADRVLDALRKLRPMGTAKLALRAGAIPREVGPTLRRMEQLGLIRSYREPGRSLLLWTLR